MKRFLILTCALSMIFGVVGVAGATLTYYADRGSFDAANPGLPLEDFEEGVVGVGGVTSFAGPLDSATNNGIFSPGDILDGVAFQENPAGRPDGLALAGPGYSGAASKLIFANYFVDTLDIFFTGDGVAAAGMDVFSEFADSLITLSIYGDSGLLGSSSVTGLMDGTATFFGVSSDADLITRINLSSATGQAEGVDNVAFGSAVPEPATLLLLGGGLVGLAALRKKFKRR